MTRIPGNLRDLARTEQSHQARSELINALIGTSRLMLAEKLYS